MKKITKIIILLILTLTIPTKKILADEKIKIGLLIPLSGDYSEMGQSIIKATKLAIDKIDNPLIEILPRDTKSNPTVTLRSAKELSQLGVKIIIGPVFNDNLIYLDELKDVTFLSLTLKSNTPPGNIIGSEILPIEVLTIMDLNSFGRIFSSTHPKSPPFIDVEDILKSKATFLKPSILILSFKSLIEDFKLPVETGLIIISESKYSFISFVASINFSCSFIS